VVHESLLCIIIMLYKTTVCDGYITYYEYDEIWDCIL